jgi:hypothetical protein
MKKLLFALTAVVMALSASAQSWWLDGQLSANRNKHGDFKNYSVSVLPEVGYNVGKWDFAAQFGLAYAYQRDGKSSSIHGASLKVNPFVRYTYANVGKIGFYIDLAAMVQTGKFFDEDVSAEDIINGTLWGIGFKPGVKYNVNNHVVFSAALGFLGYKRCHQYEFAGMSFNTGNMDIGITYVF